MNGQGDLFNQPAPRPALSLVRPMARVTDPLGSHLAAKKAAVKAPTHEQAAEQALLAAGRDGLNDFELARRVSKAMSSSSCTAISRAGGTPKNFSNRYLGPVPLRTALANSLNTVSVRLARGAVERFAPDEVGP